jgi:hypothetical protein
MAKNFIKSLTVEDGMVKLYHYSDKKIDSGFISVNKPYNVHSKNEFTVWGKSRSFFYVNEDGYRYDKGIKPKFLYVCYIPVTDIYPINDNPYKYKKFESDLNQYDSYFKQSWNDGFTAWGYFLGGNKKAPIVVSFIDLPISESYKFSKGGLKIPMEDEDLDYRIGSILIGDEKYFVMQKGGYPINLLNCYLTDEKNPKKAMRGYQKTLEVYMWDDLIIDDEYVKDYLKDLKKSKVWRKKLKESINLKPRSKEINKEKEKYIKNIINNNLNGITKNNINFFLKYINLNNFNNLTDEQKNKFIQLKIDNFIDENNISITFSKSGNSHIKDLFGLKEWEFNYLSNDKKRKYIKFLKNNNYKLNDIEKEFDKFSFKKLFGIGEGIELKSRANEIEKDKKEYIKKLIEKGIENLSSKEVLLLTSMGEYEVIFNKVKEDLGILLNYWDTSIITQKGKKGLLFTLGKTKVLFSVNLILGVYVIDRFNVDVKTLHTFNYTYKGIIEELKKILSEGDVTNE